MNTFPKDQKKPHSENIFLTPHKQNDQNSKKKLNLLQPQTQNQSNLKTIRSSVNISANSANILKKKYGKRCIKKVNLKLLNLQKIHLQDLIAINTQQTESVKDQLINQVYVFIAKIQSIQTDKKYYHFFCSDQSLNSLEILSHKNLLFKKPKDSQNRIHDIDSLVFQSDYGQGKQYFKFFVIFRQTPIFQNNDEILKNQGYTNRKDKEQDSNKLQIQLKKLPKIIKKQVRLYIQHFQKIKDYNILTFHNMSIIYQALSKKYKELREIQIDTSNNFNK